MGKGTPSTAESLLPLLKVVLLTLLMWVFLAYSPLGFSDRLDKYIQDLFNTHAGDWIYPAEHQQDTTVLLLTDEVVDAVLQGQWPAPYSFHASVLDDLLVHHPRAVFIDFYWMNQLKPGGDYLVDVLTDYQAADIPVYLSAPDTQWLEKRWPELLGLVTLVAPHMVMDPMDFVARSYPQTYRNLPSPAFAIAEDLTGTAAPDRGAMDIFWGTADNPLNLAWMQTDSEPGQNVSSVLLRGFESVNNPIPYSTTVFVRDLLNPVAATEDEALEELGEHLRDRVVIYGASLSGIQDVVFTPTRSILPGAYYHAMAIDNLLTWGESYKASVPRWQLPGMQALTLPLLHLLLLLPIACLVCFRPQLLDLVAARLPASLQPAEAGSPECEPINHLTRLQQCSNWVRKVFINSLPHLCVSLVIVAWVAFACWVQFTILHLSAATWAGFLEILSIGVIIERLDLIDRGTSVVSRFYTWLCNNGTDTDENDKSKDDADISSTSSTTDGASSR